MAEVLQKIFDFLDKTVSGFMESVFEVITEFWAKMLIGAGGGAYISVLLVSVFLIILLIVGLVKVIRKFGFFLFLLVFTVGIPLVWYLFVLNAA